MARKKTGPKPKRVDQLREYVQRHPSARAFEIAKKWRMTPQNVRNIAKRAGIKLAGTARTYSEGL